MLENRSNRARNQGSIAYQEFDIQTLSDPLHQHDGFELVYIEAGRGEWQIGQKRGRFGPGSLLLCPPKVLHLWQSEKAASGSAQAKGIVLRFGRECLPDALWELAEMESLRRLFEEADRGLVFEVPDRDRLRTRLRSIERSQGALRMARLYVALELVSTYRITQVTEKEELKKAESARATARYEAVKRFIEERFSGALTRSETAAHAGLEDAAFSRFFRQMSGTTFADYLANRRIRQAATLIGSRRDLSVPEVARMSGFRNLGAFHRQFKRRLGTTPQAYRKAANSESMAP